MPSICKNSEAVSKKREIAYQSPPGKLAPRPCDGSHIMLPARWIGFFPPDIFASAGKGSCSRGLISVISAFPSLRWSSSVGMSMSIKAHLLFVQITNYETEGYRAADAAVCNAPHRPPEIVTASSSVQSSSLIRPSSSPPRS